MDATGIGSISTMIYGDVSALEHDPDETVGMERLLQLTKLLTKDTVPGPGNYNIAKESKEPAANCVGYTEKRFKCLPWSKPNDNPGPGCY